MGARGDPAGYLQRVSVGGVQRKLINGRFLVHQLASHPLTRTDRLGAFNRIVRWQLGSRRADGPIVVPWVNGLVLVMEPGMWGATGNHYFGLLEFSEMSLVLHGLRPGELLVDVGANVGVYSLLAASVGAEALAFEPIPHTVARCDANVRENGFEHQIAVVTAAVGSAAGTVSFVADSDTNNRVASPEDEGTTIDVDVVALDDTPEAARAAMLKLDVEGYEMEALRGARRLLGAESLRVVIVETVGGADRYGASDGGIHALLSEEYDFCSVSYDPFTRRLRPIDGPGPSENTIYVRGFDELQADLLSSPAFRVWDKEI